MFCGERLPQVDTPASSQAMVDTQDNSLLVDILASNPLVDILDSSPQVHTLVSSLLVDIQVSSPLVDTLVNHNKVRPDNKVLLTFKKVTFTIV